MALTLVQHKVGRTAASQVTVPVAMTSTAAGNFLVVCTGNNGTRTVSGIADNIGNVYVQAPGAQGLGGTEATDVWYCPGALGGVTTITVTFSGAAGVFNKEAWGFEVSGFITAAFDIAGVVNGIQGVASTDSGASVLTTSTTGFVVGVILTSNSITVNPAAGNEFTAGGDISPTSDAACSLISSTAAAHQPQWTDGISNATFTSSTAAFKESPGSPAQVGVIIEPSSGPMGVQQPVTGGWT